MLGLHPEPVSFRPDNLDLGIFWDRGDDIVLCARATPHIDLRRGDVSTLQRSRASFGFLLEWAGEAFENVAWGIALLRDDFEPFTLAASYIDFGPGFDCRDRLIIRSRAATDAYLAC